MSAVPQWQNHFTPDVRCAEADRQYSCAVNPHWARLVKLPMNVHYDRCLGIELFTTEGRRILDFLAGFCVHPRAGRSGASPGDF